MFNYTLLYQLLYCILNGPVDFISCFLDFTILFFSDFKSWSRLCKQLYNIVMQSSDSAALSHLI